MELEKTINDLIHTLEGKLVRGEVHTTMPHVILQYLEQLGGYSSMVTGLLERLDTLEAQHHVDKQIEDKDISSIKVGKAWKVTKEGIRQDFWVTRLKRLNKLIDTLEKSYYSAKYEYEKNNYKQ